MTASRMDRRTVLGLAAGLGLGAGVPVRIALAGRARSDERGPDAVARWIVATPRERALARAVHELGAGLSEPDLLGGCLLAAAREVRPDVARFNHAALVVTSVGALTADLPREQRLPSLLWLVDSFKVEQERETGDDWHLAAAPTVRAPSATAARAELVRAFDAWDPPAADAALVAFVRAAPIAEVLALVQEYGLRTRSNAGHKAIYAMVVRRALPFVGERWAEDLLRSCVASFFIHGRTEDVPIFDASRELVARSLCAEGDARVADADVRREVLAMLRSRAPEDVPAAIAALVRAGAATGAIWDAYAMIAVEAAIIEPGTGPLHSVTSTTAVHHIAAHAADARLADLALLQAGVWLARARANATGALHVESLEPLPPGEPSPGANDCLARVIGPYEEGRPSAARRAVGVAADELAAAELAGAAREVVCAKADDVHEFKLTAAVLEELSRVGPEARRALLAALAVYVPDPRRASGDERTRIAEAITADARGG